MRQLFVILLLAASAFATDSFHVTTVRNLAESDPAPISRAFRVYVIVGTIGPIRYTAQQTFSWGSQHFEVGKDYEVLKSDSSSLTVLMHDKKGHGVKERLNITSTEEAK